MKRAIKYCLLVTMGFVVVGCSKESSRSSGGDGRANHADEHKKRFGGTRNGVKLWKDGPYWAETNIGAEKPWESGYYFWWGDTIGYKWENGALAASDGSSSGFSFCKVPAPTWCKERFTLEKDGWISEDGVLTPAHDAAHVQWGGGWRMPTSQELDDLVRRCDWTWARMNGVKGALVRGRGEYASASIFLPAAGLCQDSPGFADHGFYWSSVPRSSSDYNETSCRLYFDSRRHYMVDYFGREENPRFQGLSVRPVHGSYERKNVQEHKKVRLWEGGVYWAETNIGAEKPWEFGYYFWWGGTVGYYKWEDGAWVASDGSSGSSFDKLLDNLPVPHGTVDSLRERGWLGMCGLAPEHDAAHVQWGGGWRMPTCGDLSDLRSKCDWTWGRMNGVKGAFVRGRGKYASASIFLPAATGGGCNIGDTGDSAGSYFGRYWLSNPYSRYPHDSSSEDDAYCLYFYKPTSGNRISHISNMSNKRKDWLVVRPVKGIR